MRQKIVLLFLCLLSIAGIQAQTGRELPFQKWALTPPMGWNSWDCFGPTVVESEVKANAEYMATKLIQYGWEYVVVDIRWFVENDKAGGYNQVDPIYVYDEYGRYTPALNRFPSAISGKGFKPLADYIHNLGLKFGIHIMRGVPKEAVMKKLPVKGTDGITCDMIANNDSACTWLADNYKVDCTKPGAQEYYNSIFDLYAEWGVDFIKIDDLSRPYHTGEIEMIRHAIDQCGRSIVLSMSPGETPLEKYEHAKNHANMWRTVDDFWDNWEQLKYQFGICAKWAPYIAPGTWPDADMLPLGKISIRGERGNERWTNFTRDEQYTLMNLWSIFKSPLMFGGHLPENNEATDSLLTNKDVLRMHHYSTNNRQLSREDSKIVWTADDPTNGDKYAAIFHVGGNEAFLTKNALYRSGTISYLTTGHGTNIEVDIPEESKFLCLAVSDAGDGYDSDHADWINPVVVLKDGSELKLTEVEYLKGTTGWGGIRIDQNLNGEPLSINDQTYDNGFAVHANSILLFILPEGAQKFKAFAGIDNSGTSQGSKSSVEFMVFNEDPTTRSGIDPEKAVANSGLISRKYQQEGMTLTADITGAEKLYLVVTDAGDGIDYDHANWGNPVLVDANGKETSLNDLEWEGTPVNGWGPAQIGKDNDGGDLVINGVTYDKGYGVNATSIITFALPEGHNYTKFSSVVGYDNGVENADKGVTVEFLVFTQDPAPDKYTHMGLDLRQLGFADGQACTIQEMWSGQELGTYTNDEFTAPLRPHASGLYRIKAAERTEGASISISTDKTEYQGDEAFDITLSVSGGETQGAYAVLLIDGKQAGTLPLDGSSTVSYQCSGLYNGEHTFQAIYSGTTTIAPAESDILTIRIEGGEEEDLEPLRTRFLSLSDEAYKIVPEEIAGTLRQPLLDAADMDVNAMETKAEIEAAIETLTNAITAAKASIQPMKDLLEIIEKANAFIVQIADSEAKTKLTNATIEADEAYRSDESSPEDIATATASLTAALEEAKRTAEPEEGKNFEVTEYIVNPSFEVDGLNGWTITKDASGWEGTGTWGDRPCDDGQYFASIGFGDINWIDFHQDLVNLPSGQYSLSAALRNTDGIDRVTDQRIYAQVGENPAIESEPLTNVSGEGNNDWSHFTITDIIVPQGKTLRIGVKSTGKGSGNAGWFQADNFRLYYWGKAGTGIHTPTLSKKGVNIQYTENGIAITSDKKISLPIHQMAGTLYKNYELPAGETQIALPQGQYLIDGTVVIIR